MTGGKNKGFSLVEMIVAVGIFAIVSVIISELFIISSRAQNRAGISQKIQSDTRVMMAQIIDRTRSGTIDYQAYGASITSPTTELALVDENGKLVVIRKSDTDFANTVCHSVESTPCVEMSTDGGTTFFAMSSENFVVQNLAFYIDPADDPTQPSGPNVQPRVTIVMGIQSSERAGQEVGTVHVQTTVSSRVYF